MAVPTDQEILNRINTVVEDILKKKPEDLSLDSKFIEDLGADSLDTVSLLMALDQEFDEEISDKEAKGLTTIGDTLSFIKQKIAAGAV